jgi:hypothetical protein
MLENGHITCWKADVPPKEMEDVTNGRIITAGSNFTCVLTTDDRMVCPDDNPLANIARLL